MYENHWNLTRRPFENFGSADIYYPSEVHQTALLKMRYAIENGSGVIALCGDSGIGKTMLAERLIADLPKNLHPIVRIGFSRLDGDQLLGYLCDKLTGMPGDSAEPIRLTLHRLESYLQTNSEDGKRALIIIDEAHLLESKTQLETLRLLMNFPSSSHSSESSISLVLVGHGVLLSQIDQNHSLNERVAEKCLLKRFTADQTASYLQHRLKTAGTDISDLFANEAVDRIHARSMGIPRRINRLADVALMIAFAEEATRVTADHIEGVHRELATSN